MKKLFAFTISLLPLSAFAAQITDDKSLAQTAVSYGNAIITVIISLAVIYIIYGVFKYLIKGANDEESRKAGRDTILWGVVGLFVILSIWGLVGILTRSFQTNNNVPFQQFPTVGIKVP